MKIRWRDAKTCVGWAEKSDGGKKRGERLHSVFSIAGFQRQDILPSTIISPAIVGYAFATVYRRIALALGTT